MNNLHILLFSFAVLGTVNVAWAIHSENQRIEGIFTAAWAFSLAIHFAFLLAIEKLAFINIIMISLALIFSFVVFAFTPNGYLKIFRSAIMALILVLLICSIVQI